MVAAWRRIFAMMLAAMQIADGNPSLGAPEIPPRKTVAVVGDSIMVGCGSPANLGPVDLLRMRLKSRAEVLNFAVGGTTATQNVTANASFPCFKQKRWAKCDFSYAGTSQYRQLLQRTDITSIVIMLGTNDAANGVWAGSVSFSHGLYDLVQGLRRPASGSDAGNERTVIIATPPPLYLYPCPDDTTLNQTVINKVIPPLVRGVARTAGVSVVDIFNVAGGAKLSRPELFLNQSAPACQCDIGCLFVNTTYRRWDGCHPNLYGAQAIAEAIATVLQDND